MTSTWQKFVLSHVLPESMFTSKSRHPYRRRRSAFSHNPLSLSLSATFYPQFVDHILCRVWCGPHRHIVRTTVNGITPSNSVWRQPLS